MDYRGGNGGRGDEEIPQIRLDLEDIDLASLGRGARFAVLGLLLLGLLLALNWAASFWVDWLWFDALEQAEVLLTVVFTQAGLFLIGAAGFALLAGISVWIAFRSTHEGAATGEAAAGLRRGLGWVATAAVAVLAVMTGNILAGAWETVLRWRHAVPFGQTDPVFDLDIGFYVFTLPVLQLLRGWVGGAIFVTLLLTGAAYFLLSRLPSSPFGGGGGGNFRVHLAALGSALFVVVAFGHWLDRYLTLYNAQGAVHGVGYTQMHATIPAYTVMTVIALIAAALLLVGAMAEQRRVMIGAVVLWAAAAGIGTMIYPSLMQRFQVEPSELARERPFLADHIELTRQAYGLDRVVSRDHPARGEITGEIIAANQGTVQNIRLWDEGPLREIYNQIQFFRLYYDFLRVATDRYRIGDELRQVMLATRELSPEKLPSEAQRWVNSRLQFTHGYGVAMSPVTEVEADGRPTFFLSDVPPRGEPELQRPEVYYGLKSLPYVIVDTRMQEFNYPGPDGPVYSHYEGDGGVAIGGFLRQALYSWHFGDINLLISNEVEAESRIQYNRTVAERVSRLAPFLRLDSSPYPVVVDGRLFWIQDAYTVSEHFPYSLPWQGRFNYIRNSVKVVVDAYHGDVSFYVAEPDDPLIQTYDAIFPDLFRPLEEMDESLKSHIRYPRDIFTVQVQMLLQYQMQDPTVFYNKEDQWSLPQESSFQQSRVLEPYYIVARLPGEEDEEFLLIQPFTPNNRHNLVAWIAARNDPEHYGELVLFRFPSGRHVDGPNQVEARIDNDAIISEQFTLWGQVGSEVSRGNLLVIPLGDAILYAEPIFLRPETLEFPELRRIILADSRSVVMHPTLDRAVRALVGELPAVATPEETAGEMPTAAEAAPEEAARAAVGMTREEIDDLASSLERTIRELERLLERLREQGQGGGGP